MFELHSTDKPSNQEHHSVRYHLSAAPEIAIFLPGNFQAETTRTIVCAVRQPSNETFNNLQSFQDYHRSYDPLAYPLFFPRGTDGWSLTTKSRNHPFSKVSISKYVRFHLMKRNNNSFLHNGNRLFQKYITDKYDKSEFARIEYLQNNQTKLRADLI